MRHFVSYRSYLLSFRSARYLVRRSLRAMAQPSRGAFIVFEGIDRSGKSSQSKRLVEELTAINIPAELIKFPDRSTLVGSILDQYLSGTVASADDAIHLLFATNRLEKRSELLAKLNSGVTIVSDRYAFSGAAYTMAKGKDGMDKEWCKKVEAGKLPQPDLIFYMDIPVKTAACRSGFGQECYENENTLESVKQAFRELMEEREEWRLIQGEESPEKITKQILNSSLEVIESCKNGKQLKQLWMD